MSEPGYGDIAKISDPLEALEALGRLPASSQREGAATAIVRHALMDGAADQLAPDLADGGDQGDAPEWPAGAVPIDGPSAIAYVLGDGKASPGSPLAGAV